MKWAFIAILASYIFWPIWCFPESGFVTCDLVSVRRPELGFLLDRDSVMGLEVLRNPEPPIAVSLETEAGNDRWLRVNIGNHYAIGIVAFTDNGELEMEDENVPTGCTGTRDIVYEIGPGSELRWAPGDENSKLWVFQSLGPSKQFFRIQTVLPSEAVAAQAGGDNDGLFKDDLFAVTVAFLTVLYAAFLWDTLKPAAKH